MTTTTVMTLRHNIKLHKLGKFERRLCYAEERESKSIS